MRISARLVIILLAFTPLWIRAQTSDKTEEAIDFSDITFAERIDSDFWKRKNIEGITVAGYPSKIIFGRPIHFCLTHFDSKADFFWAQFHSVADFDQAQFHSTADFTQAKFYSVAYFTLAQFYSAASFWSAQFDSTADFLHTQFHSTANFQFDEFHSLAGFIDAQFDSIAVFSFCHFNSTAGFDHARFNTKADFSFAMFRHKAGFYRAVLPDTLIFSGVTDIARDIDFNFARLPRSGNRCKIELVGADISKIKLNMKLFELWFSPDTTIDTIWVKTETTVNTGVTTHGTIIDTIRVRTDTLAVTYDQKVSVYEQVLKKLKDDGMMESYQILDIEYRKFKYENAGIGGAILNVIYMLWWNYSYTPERIFLWAIILWLFFSLINLLMYNTLNEAVYEIPFLMKLQPETGAGERRWLYYPLQVVTYTAAIFFGLKMDPGKFKTGVVRRHPCLFAYLMIVYVSGLICLGFIVNIIFTR
jgi:hypothetical protein